MMKGKIVKRILAILFAACVLCGCGLENLEKLKDLKDLQELQNLQDSKDSKDLKALKEMLEGLSAWLSKEGGGETQALPVSAEIARPMLISMDQAAGKGMEMETPNVAPYAVNSDLSNIDNLWQFYIEDGAKELLVRNGFVVRSGGSGGSEFYEMYEDNRYFMAPNFVTVDSLMHTYHLYFSHLMKNIEKRYLSNALCTLSAMMAENSALQYEALKGSEWEEAARRNVAFFTVGAMLLETPVPNYDYAADMVSKELGAIGSASQIDFSAITGEEEDYSQYVPRGYYEGDVFLERYFKAMMWYGRTHFTQKEEDLDRSALLITLALKENAEAYRLWEGIYAVTSFFAGASDDAGICEYVSLIDSAYGGNVSVGDLAGDRKSFEKFHAMTAVLEPPKINSIPIWQGEENIIRGFRFMGQRFTIDAAIMQLLVDGEVKDRMLPDVLDVPAALGSDAALQILEEQGDTAYNGYSENMEAMRQGLSQENRGLWTASLYANWLNTLRPLLDKKGEGYPFFMQNAEWAKKNLECFAGSFTELKHDTVLYSKQVIAEMGGGMEEEPDDRGYVEPEPLVYARFADLASLTAEGLQRYGMLDAADEENLSKLADLARILLEISQKELRDEVLTAQEYDFIRAYGGNLEHFWIEAVEKEREGDIESPMDAPAAVVVDIATDPNGQVLEVATGNPSVIYVAVKVDGKVKIAKGSVYSFYQFPWPMSDRLTDSKWCYMMGYQADENGNWIYGKERPVDQPWWTASYRYED